MLHGSRRQIILTFDAFGTLFTPKEPIARTYVNSARRHGMFGFAEEEIDGEFRKAFKHHYLVTPNYGQSVGMEASQWWSNVIKSTFEAFGPDKHVVDQLVPSLLKHFSSSEGYQLYPDVMPMFESLKELKQTFSNNPDALHLTTGLITNSDDRVLSILPSLELQIGSGRYGNPAHSRAASKGRDIRDIDFVTLSYDVGFEKPEIEIFDAAKTLGNHYFGDNDGIRHIHVGDDIDKDFHAAKAAGWEAYFLDRENQTHDAGTKISSLSALKHILESA